MDKFGHVARASDDWSSFDSSSVAETVAKDFSGLVAMFDRHLKTSASRDSEALAVLKARAAAERGLELSQRLLELTRNSSRRG
jgi:hypothetical protein